MDNEDDNNQNRKEQKMKETMKDYNTSNTPAHNRKTRITRAVYKMCVAFALSAMPTFTQAQTHHCGDISGTWTPAGNPHIVSCDATVPSGQTLTIQPGVIVWIGLDVSITANGVIQAVGNSTNRITFQSPGTSSQFWSTIRVNGTADVNRFKYCNFQNASYALYFNNNTINEVMYSSFQNVAYGIVMDVGAGNYVQTTKIMNCNFADCSDYGIWGHANGYGQVRWDGWRYYPYTESATIDADIRNCIFSEVNNGCGFYLRGTRESFQGVVAIGRGYSNLKILNNVYSTVTNVAILLSVGNYPGGGPATLMNNTMVNCHVGIDVTDPWDARVQDNIIVGATNAVQVAGSLSRSVSYNCFYQNAANFIGYPLPYGNWIIANRNGTPSDILYNILQDPKFVATNDFHLQTNSPCIDAGTPDWAYSDMCFTNSLSQGTSYPDLGAYGGPDACNWLDVVPKLPAQATMSKSGDVIQINWGAIPRSEYQIQYQTNWPSTNWVNFPNGWVRASDKPTPLVVATDTSITNRFFRIQSLGRKPGN